MIPHFPTPHPDELLYSLCARYGDRTRYWNKGVISLELFGLKDATATIDLPSRLGYLVKNLPAGHLLHWKLSLLTLSIISIDLSIMPIQLASG